MKTKFHKTFYNYSNCKLQFDSKNKFIRMIDNIFAYTSVEEMRNTTSADRKHTN